MVKIFVLAFCIYGQDTCPVQEGYYALKDACETDMARLPELVEFGGELRIIKACVEEEIEADEE